MADESIQTASAIRARPTLIALVALKPGGVLIAAVVLAVPLAIDPFGLRAFLPVKQAALLFGAALIALIAAVGYAGTAWRARMPMRRSAPFHEPQHAGSASGSSCENSTRARLQTDSRVGLCLIGAPLALWLWSLIVVTPHALNPALHLGFGWSGLSAHLVIFFAALLCARAARNAGSQRNFERLLGAVAVTTLVMAGHACLQAANVDPLAWIVGKSVQESGRWRIFTTTGNPDWTAEYLAAAAPIAVWWFSRFTRGAALLWLLFAIAILPTGSRLGLAALAVGAAIHTWMRRRACSEGFIARRRMHVFFAALIAAGLFVYLLRDLGYAEALLRWRDFHSVLGRLQLWQASLHLIVARPLDGYGLDHFALVLPDGLRAVAAPLDPVTRSHMPDLLTAHAHNDFLEMGVETGIPGAFLLLALFALGLYAATKPSADLQAPSHIRAPSATPALGASLGVLFTLAMASAPLHTPATALLFWVVLGCLAGATPVTLPDLWRHTPSRLKWQRAGAILATCAMLTALGWAGNRTLVLLTENRQAAAAAAMAAAGQTHAAELGYEAAWGGAPWDHESGVALASLLLDSNRPAAALRVLDQIDTWSQSRESWLVRAHALLRQHDVGSALQVMEHATFAVPDFLRAEMLQARLATHLGRMSEANAAYRQALLSPQRSPRARQIMFEAAQALAGKTQETP